MEYYHPDQNKWVDFWPVDPVPLMPKPDCLFGKYVIGVMGFHIAWAYVTVHKDSVRVKPKVMTETQSMQ